ncbi:MAG: aminotransferase class I/II-fold pyridoxal phosphate-dependent enzyme, partial [bacterium]
FSERRDYVVDRLKKMAGITVVKPSGAFYVYPNFSRFLEKRSHEKAIHTTLDIAAYLIENAGVAVVPGEAFGSTENIRISYANSMENLRKAMDQIEAALCMLQ